jgi:hypothetical protein
MSHFVTCPSGNVYSKMIDAGLLANYYGTSITSLGSIQIFRVPHLRTEAASRFCSFNETIFQIVSSKLRGSRKYFRCAFVREMRLSAWMLVALSEQMFGDKTEQLQLRRTVQSYRMYTYGSASEGNDTVVQLYVYTYVPVVVPSYLRRKETSVWRYHNILFLSYVIVHVRVLYVYTRWYLLKFRHWVNTVVYCTCTWTRTWLPAKKVNK